MYLGFGFFSLVIFQDVKQCRLSLGSLATRDVDDILLQYFKN